MTEAPANLGILLRKRLTVKGSTLRSRSLDYKAQLTREVQKTWPLNQLHLPPFLSLSLKFSQQVIPLFSSGQLRVVVDSCYPLENVQEAHRRMSSNLNSGKIILTVQ